jgi:phosphoglycerate dehydrogenase-like enzyme
VNLHTAFAMRPSLPRRLFDAQAMAEIARIADLHPAAIDDFARPEVTGVLGEMEVLLTGWHCPLLDAAALDRMPKLRAVLHAAGSIKAHVTKEVFRRGIAVSTAADANAQPVAEYTLGMILLSGKGAFRLQHDYRRRRAALDLINAYPTIGNNGRRVGIVGASRIGRRVIELLRPFDVTVCVFDPYLSRVEASQLGITQAGLDELLAHSDVVSLHAPSLPETRHLLDRRRLALIPDGATLINTARGALVDTAALANELASGRIFAVLDVAEPEILAASDPLYDLPNVVLTPHIAGALGNELPRLGRSAVSELRRLAASQPLAYPVTIDDLARSA